LIIFEFSDIISDRLAHVFQNLVEPEVEFEKNNSH
jgi:hypothetical protein